MLLASIMHQVDRPASTMAVISGRSSRYQTDTRVRWNLSCDVDGPRWPNARRVKIPCFHRECLDNRFTDTRQGICPSAAADMRW